MQLNKIVRWITLGGIFLIPILPLVVTNSLFFPFITGKNFEFRILVEIIFAAYLILVIRDQNYTPKKSWLLTVFSVFMAIVLIADVTGQNPHKSFWSNYERMEGYIGLLHLFAFFIVSSAVLSTEKLWRYFFNFSIFISVVIAFYGFLQLGGKLDIHQGGVRLDATFGNAIYLAAYMMFHFFLSLMYLLRTLSEKAKSKNWWVACAYIAAMILEAITIYFTATRGTILGLGAGVILLCILLSIFERQNKIIKNSAITILALIIVALVGFVAARNSQFVQQSQVLSRFSSLLDTRLSGLSSSEAGARLGIWKIALKGFKDHPILGWGQESFNYTFNKYYDPKLYAQELWFDRAHNAFLDWLNAAGVLGFLGYIGLFVAALYYLWKRSFESNDRLVLTALLIAYAIHNLFVFDNLTSYIFFFAVLAYIHSRAAEPYKNIESFIKKNQDNVTSFGVPVVIIAFCFFIYFLNVRAVIASYNLVQAVSPQKDPNTNIAYFHTALDWDSLGTYEAREHLTSMAISARGVNIDPLVKTNLFNFARDEMQKQLQETPHDTRYLVFTGNLLDIYGDYADAIAVLEKARQESPQKQAILMELGGDYINIGNIGQGVVLYKQAFESAPDYSDARIAYAAAAIISGDQKTVDSLLIPVYGTSLVPDQKIIQAYGYAKQYDKVIAILKKQLNDNPADFNSHLLLASTYLNAGLRVNAINELRIAISLNPQFKNQGEYYVKEIEAGRNP